MQSKDTQVLEKTEVQTELPREVEGAGQFVEPAPMATEVKLKTESSSPRTVDEFLTKFVKGTLGRKRLMGKNYIISREGKAEKLEYVAQGDVGWDWQTRDNRPRRETIAVRFNDGLTFMNANRLILCGSYMAWGNRSSGYNNAQTSQQRTLERAGAMAVPFSVFTQAKLDITQTEVVQKAPSEIITVAMPADYNAKIGEDGVYAGASGNKVQDETRHYVGASLLKVGDSYFLFDIDREELKHKIFNPFVVKLARACKTIEDAYQSLVPVKVTMALTGGHKVERQGEWFFIERYTNQETVEFSGAPADLLERAKNPPHAKDFGATQIPDDYKAGNKSYMRGLQFDSGEDTKAYDRVREAWAEVKAEAELYTPRAGQLQHGTSRPNIAELLVKHNTGIEEIVLVSGKIEHSGREHRDVNLVGWWEAVGNTAIGAWQVSGDID